MNTDRHLNYCDVNEILLGPRTRIHEPVTATGTGGWTQTGQITVLGFSNGLPIQQPIASGDDWTVSVTAVDANGVPSNPLYTFRVTRP